MDPENKRQKLSSESSQVIDVDEAMKKQNDVAMFLAGKVISTVATNSNFVFSPASITAVLTMTATTSEVEQLRSFILSFLGSSSPYELNAVFNKIATVVLTDGSADGGPKISAVNGVWVEQSLPVNHSAKDLIENFFNATFSIVDFRSKPFKVLRLPYRRSRNNTNIFSMYLYLPDKIDGLDHLLERMTSTDGFVDTHIPEWRDRVGQFRIPKFKKEFGFEVSSAFPGLELDVSFYHKAMIEVDGVPRLLLIL